eukprot:911624-Pyramimonas_sp.AAC.1
MLNIRTVGNHNYNTLPRFRSADVSNENDAANCRKARAARSHSTEAYIVITCIAVSASTVRS